jgi:carboxylate-amine ligase
MAEEYGEIARAQLTCGQHVHVGVESRAEGVAVLDRIRDWLPVIRAISANSPYWQGSDTGYASFRTVQWGQWPTAGPIPVLGGEQRYDEEVTALVETGAALDLGMIYFDARLSARFATVEIRVADVSTEISTSVLVACLCRALVETAAREAAAGAAPLGTGVGVLRAASWRAARHGLLEHLVLPGSSRPVPAWEAVERLVEHVRAVLSAEERAVVAEALTALRTAGTGSEGQRRVAAAHGLPEMVLEAAERTIGHEPSG